MAESPYLIRFIQLPAGYHEFSFRIEDSFFGDRENSIIQKADIQVSAGLQKGSGAMQLDLVMEGEVVVDCVRCLESFVLPVSFEKHLVVRMVDHPENEDDDDDAIHIAKTAHDIELSNTLYDFISLEVPYNPVHPENEDGSDGCDPEVLKHLKKAEEERQNEEKSPEDDRWAELKKIKLN